MTVLCHCRRDQNCDIEGDRRMWTRRLETLPALECFAADRKQLLEARVEKDEAKKSVGRAAERFAGEVEVVDVLGAEFVNFGNLRWTLVVVDAPLQEIGDSGA